MNNFEKISKANAISSKDMYSYYTYLYTSGTDNKSIFNDKHNIQNFSNTF